AAIDEDVLEASRSLHGEKEEVAEADAIHAHPQPVWTDDIPVRRSSGRFGGSAWLRSGIGRARLPALWRSAWRSASPSFAFARRGPRPCLSGRALPPLVRRRLLLFCPRTLRRAPASPCSHGQSPP